MPRGYMITINRPQGSLEIFESGDMEYLCHKQIHRDAGPAMIFRNGYSVWLQFSTLHCTTGPAVIQPDGRKEYWVNDKQLQCDEFFLQYGVL